MLSPADVHNVTFTRAPVGRRGYDEAQVEAFRESVEATLVEHVETQHAQTAPAAEVPGNETETVSLMLTMASETADRYVAEAQAQAQALLAGAQEQRDAVVGVAEATVAAANEHRAAILAEAEAERDTVLAETSEALAAAQARRDGVLEEVQATRDALLAEAREAVAAAEARAAEIEAAAISEADSLLETTRQEHATAVEALEQNRLAVQGRVEALQAHEQETRTRLRLFLEAQLRDLEQAPVDAYHAAVREQESAEVAQG
jgi:DivIVA domain-containing protein